MTTLSNIGSSIEGIRITGQSRHPIRRKSRNVKKSQCIMGGQKCTVYVAVHNVQSTIQIELTKNCQKLIEDSLTSVHTVLSCEKAFAYTTAKKLTPENDVKHGSGKHKTNKWGFSKQTAIEIERARRD